MKKSLIAASLTAALILSPLSVPAVGAEETTAPTTTTSVTDADSTNPADTTDTSEEVAADGEVSGSSSVGTIVGILAAVGVIAGAIAAGVTWAVGQGLIPNPLPGIIPGPPAPAPEPAPAPVPVAAPEPAPAPAPAPVAAQAPAPAPVSTAYPNCRAVWDALGRPIRSYEDGFQSKLDADGDGIGCESRPR